MKTFGMAPAAFACVLAAAACSGSGDASSGEQEKAGAPVIAETPEAYREFAATLRREGKFKEAADTALKAYVLARTGPRVAERLEIAKANGAAGKSAGAINEIKSLETEKRDGKIELDEVSIAEVYAVVGDPNSVFRWLTRAHEKKSPKLMNLATNPDLKGVHEDPRWAPFLQQIGQ